MIVDGIIIIGLVGVIVYLFVNRDKKDRPTSGGGHPGNEPFDPPDDTINRR